MSAVREPAVAGMFYPADPVELREQVAALLASAKSTPAEGSPSAVTTGRDMLRAVIAPHAGYIYSGPTAAHAYARIAEQAHRYARVLLLGPTHRVAVDGLALPGAEALRTPLGDVPVDPALAARAADLPHVLTSPEAHRQEHALEVHLPFIQEVLPGRPVLPLAVGRATHEQVADTIDTLLTDDTLVIISTDLSHYLPQAEAVATDRATLGQVLALDPTITHQQACGATPLVGLLTLARRRGWLPQLLDRSTSADTAGTPDRVVGYAAVTFTGSANGEEGDLAAAEAGLSIEDAQLAAFLALPALARAAIERHLGIEPARQHAPRGGPRSERGQLADPGYRCAEVHTGVDSGGDGGAAAHPDVLTRPGASFITLTRHDGSLRGCIGSLAAHRPLGEDVAAHAATRDPRFRPVTADELGDLHIEVSVLSDPEPLTTGADSTEAEAIAMLRPGRDGVILQAGGRRATFLPQVWESLTDPADFLDHLRRKAGLPSGYWGPDVELQRYGVTAIHESAGEATPSAAALGPGGAGGAPR